MTYLDTRDLLTELDELELRQVNVSDMRDDPDPELTEDERAAEIAEIALDDDERERLTILQELRDEIGERTMRDGETMIPDADFEDYARELAEDIGAIPAEYTWPASCIDWEQAANDLKMDYISVTFDGTDYWVRSC